MIEMIHFFGSPFVVELPNISSRTFLVNATPTAVCTRMSLHLAVRCWMICRMKFSNLFQITILWMIIGPIYCHSFWVIYNFGSKFFFAHGTPDDILQTCPLGLRSESYAITMGHTHVTFEWMRNHFINLERKNKSASLPSFFSSNMLLCYHFTVHWQAL